MHKCGAENTKPRMFIEELVPTMEGQGICYTHPENLPTMEPRPC
jgi:hypothetical protein